MKSITNQNKTILRHPTTSEIKASGINPSDYQIAQLRILSKILFDFGLVKKIYRAKRTYLKGNNINRLEKYRKKINSLFSFFNEEDDVSNFRSLFYLVEEVEDSFLVNDYISIFKKLKEQNSLRFLRDIVINSYKKIKNINALTDKDLSKIDSIVSNISEVVSFIAISDAPKILSFVGSISDTFHNDEDMKNAANILYVKKVSNIKELKNLINDYIDENKHGEEVVYSFTALSNEANENLSKLENELKTHGYEVMCVDNIFKYFKEYKPEIIDNLSVQYGLSKDEMNGDRFKTWEDLARFFYTPEMIKRIENEQVKADNRSRSKDISRKGSYLNVDLRSIEKRKKRLLKRLEGRNMIVDAGIIFRINELEAKLAEKEEEYEEAKEKRNKIKADLGEAEILENLNLYNDLEKIYKEANRLTNKIGKSVSNIRLAIKKLKNSSTSSTVSKNDIDLLRQLEEEEKKVINKALNVLNPNGEVVEPQHEIQRLVSSIYDLNDIKYRTTSFILNTDDLEVIDFIIKMLSSSSGLHQATGGKEQPDGSFDDGYFNVDAYKPRYNDIVTRATEIFIDYPEECMLSKILESNPTMCHQMIDSIIYHVRTELKKQITYINDDDKIRINERF